MKKELIINNESFVFTYLEHSREWLLKDADYLDGYETELYIDCRIFADEIVDWSQVEKFILFLRSDFTWVVENISRGKSSLKALYQDANLRYEEWEILKNVEFEMFGIAFQGYSKRSSNHFAYDYIMKPRYTKDLHREMGMDLWRASFVRYNLVGVSRGGY